jgi:Domain of unknown function (DUF3883)
MLVPFAIAQTAPDPVMPWIALDGSKLWELEKPSGATSVTESDVKSLNLAAGLSDDMYRYVVGDGETIGFVDAAVDLFTTLMGSEPVYVPLLNELGFANRGTISGVVGSPDAVDAIAALEAVNNPRRKFAKRLSAAENKAIEERAVLQVTREHFEKKLGYATEDVGKTRSYDVHATKGDEVVKVEVKGTTTNGAGVVLTRNEVNLHRTEHPNNALAVVRDIALRHSGEKPFATGGELVLVMPWEIDDAALSAIAYEYSTGI